MASLKLHRSFFIVLALGTLMVSAPVALLLGVAMALAWGNPYAALTKKLMTKILSWSIIGMGAGMNLLMVLKAGAHGMIYTLVGITSTLIFGKYLAKWLKADRETALLISVGTAICGGSAIAAVASTLHVKDSSMSVSLATVFLLNALALVIFPIIGHALDLSQGQFGFFSALAIHDTSSVVGASLAYGKEAFEIGTTVKLARALWIVPLTLVLARFYKDKIAGRVEAKKPYFILGFLAAAAIVTLIPSLKPLGNFIAEVAKSTLSVALFLIGASLDKDSLRVLGIRPLIFGVILWITIATASLSAIVLGIVD
jgi:uncharacterized membrane protein YadS